MVLWHCNSLSLSLSSLAFTLLAHSKWNHAHIRNQSKCYAPLSTEKNHISRSLDVSYRALITLIFAVLKLGLRKGWAIEINALSFQWPYPLIFAGLPFGPFSHSIWTILLTERGKMLPFSIPLAVTRLTLIKAGFLCWSHWIAYM